MSAIPFIDIASLVWFAAVWVGYTWYADRAARRASSLRAVMHGHRYVWMQRMLQRGNRSWFANTWLFMFATTLVMGVLYWREYRLQAMQSLRFVADIKK